MTVLACLAAESRTDGGAGLQTLLQDAKFDLRPRLSLTKHTAAERAGAFSHKAA